MSRIAKLTPAVLGLCGFLQLGCAGLFPGSSDASSSNFSDAARAALANVVTLEIINNVKDAAGTPYKVELDITIDGIPQTLIAERGIATKYALTTCPAEVRTVTERWLDDKDRVVGGRDYSNVDANSFLAGSFNCGSVLMWQLSAEGVTTQAL